MSAKAFKSHIATGAASTKRETHTKGGTVAGIRAHDHAERDKVIRRLKESNGERSSRSTRRR